MVIDNWLDSADYDAWRMTEVVDVDTPGMREDDDSDQDNSLGWADYLDEAEVAPHYCPVCGQGLQNDPADPDVGIMYGVVYCETPGCDWPGQTY